VRNGKRIVLFYCLSIIVIIIIISSSSSIIILYSEQPMHNYSTNYHTATCFDTTVPSSDSLQSVPRQVTPVFQMQLSVIQFTVKMFHRGLVEINM
jgi:hypothetical protein